ncbi:MAG: hypothetical protein RR922_00885 [Clostridia bacterium]
MLNNKTRIVCVIIILALLLGIMLTRGENKNNEKKPNYYASKFTESNYDYGLDVENEMKTFFKILEDKNFEKAYSMLDETSKKESFKSVNEFKTFVEKYLVDVNKCRKTLEYSFVTTQIEGNKKVYTYSLSFVLNDEDGTLTELLKSKTTAELNEFYGYREFTLDIIETNPYEFKMGLNKKIVE